MQEESINRAIIVIQTNMTPSGTVKLLKSVETNPLSKASIRRYGTEIHTRTIYGTRINDKYNRTRISPQACCIDRCREKGAIAVSASQ